MTKIPLFRLGVVALSLVLTACAQPGPGAYRGYDNAPIYSESRRGGAGSGGGYEARYEAQTDYGRVSAIDTVRDQRRAGSTGAGGLIGAVAGAILGRQFGNSGSGRATGTVLGAFGGAILGDTIERQQNGGGDPQAAVFRVSVQLERGGLRAFDFATVGDLRVGDRVRVENGQLYRL